MSVAPVQDVIQVVQGDPRFPLEMQLIEYRCADQCEVEAPINLGEVDLVRLLIYSNKVLQQSFDCNFIGAPQNGQVVVDFWSDVWMEQGDYIGEVEITYSAGGCKTMENVIPFHVRSKGVKR